MGGKIMAVGGMYVYVSNADSKEIFVLRLDPENGELTEVQRISVTGRIMPMAVGPDRRFLYAAQLSAPFCVASFAIEPLSGRLTHLAYAPVFDAMPYICTDRTGRFLLGAMNPADKA